MEKKPSKRKSSTNKARKIPRTKRTPGSDKPSHVTDRYWLHAFRKKGKYPEATENSGKWLVFVKVNELAEAWERIKKATEEGLLGDSAKVGTMRPNPHGKDTDSKVICVYTYDWTDEADVRRIRENLRKIGIINKIPYKADEDTSKGKYAVRGDKRISKYYE